MRDNGSVTNRPIEVPEGTFLISRTDPLGIITYANRAFIQISGYRRDQLIGQPHNLVRHPDMPPAAFADLWATIQAGRGWVGVVKNRCANGDHYWVRATVSPEIGSDGAITGFVSVRVRPSASEVATAEQAYARLNSGEKKHAVVGGRLRHRGLIAAAWRLLGQTRVRLALTFGVLMAVLVVASLSSLNAMRSAQDRIEHLSSDRLACTRQLNIVSSRTRDNWSLLSQVSLGSAPNDALARITANRAAISREIDAYLASPLTAEESVMADKLKTARTRFAAAVIAPGIEAAEKNRKIVLHDLLTPENAHLLDEVSRLCDELIQLQVTVGQQLVVASRQEYQRQQMVAGGLGALALLIAVAAGILMSRRLGNGLTSVHDALRDVVNGRLDTVLDLDRTDEFGRLHSQLAVLQTRISYVELKARESRTDLMDDFDRSLGAVLTTLKQRISELEATAGQQGTAATEFAGTAQSVSSSATELSASIREIATQASSASELARQCAERTKAGVEVMNHLSKAAGEISGVAKIIRQIADKTNLLALNATIEAASAGEAGRSFAVVANEVKALASQTGSATGSIGDRITAVLADTTKSEQALLAVSESVARLTDAANAIAAAVEEQSAVVEEVARGASKSSDAATASGEGARDITNAAVALAEGAAALSEAASRFKEGLNQA